MKASHIPDRNARCWGYVVAVSRSSLGVDTAFPEAYGSQRSESGLTYEEAKRGLAMARGAALTGKLAIVEDCLLVMNNEGEFERFPEGPNVF